MDDITDSMKELNIEENGLDMQELCDIFERDNVRFSMSLVKRVAQAYKLFRCNQCSAYYGTIFIDGVIDTH